MLLLQAAAETWRLGLLRKGLGLCHGIGGNALALMAMFRMTGSSRATRLPSRHSLSTPARLGRGHAVLVAGAEVLRVCAEAQVRACCSCTTPAHPPRPSRSSSEAKGQPDAPYSLMEGLAGFVVALTGVCTGDACFPGYDGLI